MSTSVPSTSEATDLDFVTRFVCTGSEEGCHCIVPKQDFMITSSSLYPFLKREAAFDVIRRLRTIFERRSFVTKDPLLFALAMVVRNLPVTDGNENDTVRHGAYDLVIDACESPMDLFTFVSFDKTVSGHKKAGWGRGMKRIVRQWYESKKPLDLAYQVTKCKSGRGWTHRDLIRQSHLRPDKKSKGTSVVLNYIAQGKKILDEVKEDEEEEDAQKVVSFLKDVELLTATKLEDKDVIRSLIEKQQFLERQIPSHFFQIKETFEGLLGHLELINIFRSIPKMASLGMLDHAAPEVSKVIDRVRNFDAIKEQKVPPIIIFIALRRYEANKAKKWVKNQSVVKALQVAFNASLQCLPKTGKKTLLAIHINSKLSKRQVSGANFLTPLMPCALMAKFLLLSESQVQVVYFHQKVVELKLTPKSPLPGIIENIVKPTKEPANEYCDLAEPLKWAAQDERPFENILIICDKKTVSSSEVFCDALKTYRSKLSLPSAKLVLIGLSDTTVIGNKFDLNMLEICGFNERVPPLIYNFFSGNMDFTEDAAVPTETVASAVVLQ